LRRRSSLQQKHEDEEEEEQQKSTCRSRRHCCCGLSPRLQAAADRENTQKKLNTERKSQRQAATSSSSRWLLVSQRGSRATRRRRAGGRGWERRKREGMKKTGVRSLAGPTGGLSLVTYRRLAHCCCVEEKGDGGERPRPGALNGGRLPLSTSAAASPPQPRRHSGTPPPSWNPSTLRLRMLLTLGGAKLMKPPPGRPPCAARSIGPPHVPKSQLLHIVARYVRDHVFLYEPVPASRGPKHVLEEASPAMGSIRDLETVATA
jgi:hypothetical protein